MVALAAVGVVVAVVQMLVWCVIKVAARVVAGCTSKIICSSSSSSSSRL